MFQSNFLNVLCPTNSIQLISPADQFISLQLCLLFTSCVPFIFYLFVFNFDFIAQRFSKELSWLISQYYVQLVGLLRFNKEPNSDKSPFSWFFHMDSIDRIPLVYGFSSRVYLFTFLPILISIFDSFGEP